MTLPRFPKLFSEGQIGNLKIKNRIVMLPMARQFQGFNGEVTQKTVDYYSERAKGGLGMIIVGSTRVFPPGHQFFTPASLNIGDPRYLPGHCDLVEAIHDQGVKVSIQFGHIGGQTVLPSVSASGVQQYFCDGTVYSKPRPILRSEIYDLIELFGEGALKAQIAGYDMVEIHAAHDYLLGGFLSPKLNQRTDDFGGSVEHRCRIIRELIAEIKKKTGDDFPVCVRISADDYIKDSITLEDSCKVAQILEQAGADVISVSAGSHETQHLSNDIMRLEEDFKRPLFTSIKKEISIPIIVAGGYRNPDKAEQIVADGIADFLGMARTFLADPQWPLKAREGRSKDIRRCVSCGECLYQRGGKFTLPLACSVNPLFGREGKWKRLEPAASSKRVVVIGGGPAGMEAARVASQCGHEVMLYEKGEELGGQLLLAAAPPGKKRLLWIRDYLAHQLQKNKVSTTMGQECSQDMLKQVNPDVVILATGARPKAPDFVDFTDERVVQSWDILAGTVSPRGQNVVVIGGNMLGCETAEFLAEKGYTVSILKMRAGEDMAEDCEPTNRRGLLDSLASYGVGFVSGCTLEALTPEGLNVLQRDSGQECSIGAETIVVALGAESVRDLYSEFVSDRFALHLIGDCRKTGNIRQAMYDGACIGRQI